MDDQIVNMYLNELELPTTPFFVDAIHAYLRDPDHHGAGPGNRRTFARTCNQLMRLASVPALMLSANVHVEDVLVHYLWQNEARDVRVMFLNVSAAAHYTVTAILLLYTGDAAVRRLLQQRCTVDILAPLAAVTSEPAVQASLGDLCIGYTGPVEISATQCLEHIVRHVAMDLPSDTVRTVVEHNLSILQHTEGRAWPVRPIVVHSLGILLEHTFIQELPETLEAMQDCLLHAFLFLNDPENFLFERSQSSGGRPARHLDNVVRFEADVAQPNACALCLEPMREGQALVKLPCGHVFHDQLDEQCAGAIEWLQGGTQCTGNGTCPLCKQRVDESTDVGGPDD